MTMTALRDLLDADSVPCIVSIVTLHDGETQHWRINEEGKLEIQVKSLTHGVPIRAMMKGGGVWRIPPIDSEVVIQFDLGDFDAPAYLIAVVDDAPASLVADEIVLVSGKIRVMSADGETTHRVALAHEVETLADDFYGHMHVSAAPSSPTTAAGPGPTGAPPFVSPGFPGSPILEAQGE